MKFQYLLIGTSLTLIPYLTSAQCVATQDCAALGYTENSCSGSNGIKCPFGNKWACFKTDTEFCNEYGFTHSCTQTNQIGVGKACNGKYFECSCTSGYIWNDLSQKCEYDYKTNCIIGALYYADGTCSNDYISNKKLLGIVIYEKSDEENGWVMTHKPIATTIEWGGYGTDIPGLNNYNTYPAPPTDIQASCANTDIITGYGSSSTYLAAWEAKNYKEGNKTWCLPSGGLLNNINNSVNFAKINAGITIAQGTILGNVSDGWEGVWSSSEHSKNNVWFFTADTKGSFSMSTNTKNNYDYYYKYGSVRPVMKF